MLKCIQQPRLWGRFFCVEAPVIIVMTIMSGKNTFKCWYVRWIHTLKYLHSKSFFFLLPALLLKWLFFCIFTVVYCNYKNINIQQSDQRHFTSIGNCSFISRILYCSPVTCKCRYTQCFYNNMLASIDFQDTCKYCNRSSWTWSHHTLQTFKDVIFKTVQSQTISISW